MAKSSARPARPPFAKAQKHLAKCHPAFARLVKLVGPCTMTPGGEPFELLVRSIISQQISTKAAVSIGAKLQALLPGGRLTPAGVHGLTEEALRSCGLSGGKRRFIRALTERVHSGALDLARVAGLPDEAIAAELLPVPGIGPWTVDMFLIFGLGRPDVLPVGDLGLRMGVKEVFGLAEPPGKAELVALAEPWRPFRSVATWYLWRSRGFVPQSRMEV
jgi:DNA-3-methyladenine glycosylase II